jgi:hypothetical protein
MNLLKISRCPESMHKPSCFTIIILCLSIMPAQAALNVSLTVKENAGANLTSYPTSVVIPLPQGQYFSTTGLGIAETPSQIEVLERWPGDNSLRHVLVHFQASVARNANTPYTLTASAQHTVTTPVIVTNNTSEIIVSTGPLKFTINKVAFNLVDQVWLDQNGNHLFETGEQIISSHPLNGGVFVPRSQAGATQYDASRGRVNVTVEEDGPLRAVIRAALPARFVSTTSHQHGFAVRIYAYAGKPYIKIDYQLQNSDKTVARSWPLYFEAMDLDFRLNLDNSANIKFGIGNGSIRTAAISAGGRIAQEMHNRFKIYTLQSGAVMYDSGTLNNGTGPEGFVDVSDAQRGVTAVIRNFWQTWPNGLQVDAQKKLSIQLFPSWSCQWYDHRLSPTGLFWLEDMQHVYKEILLNFHGSNADEQELVRLANAFQFPPVACVPSEWYRTTRATLDLGGVLPPEALIPVAQDHRQPEYFTPGFELSDWYDSTGPFYGAGWVNFWDPEPGYRSAACTPGGWPYSSAPFMASGQPADYFTAEAHAMAELNLRPQWMAEYSHDLDWASLRLSENPYCGGWWRLYDGEAGSIFAAPPLPATMTADELPVYYARDDQHGWFYHVAEAYWLTANPWIKDWYEFVAEFRRVRLERLDPFPDYSSRATAHALNHVLQACRVSGNPQLLIRFRDHIATYLVPEQDPCYGDQKISVEENGGGFQTGYLARTIIDYLEEVKAKRDWQAYAEGFNYLSGFMEWNYNFGNFPYYFDARGGGTGTSSGTGLSLIDPQSWYYWHTGKSKYWRQINAFITTGIQCGGDPPCEQPYGNFTDWSGQFEGRYYLYVKHSARPDTIPPVRVTDLSVITDGSGVRLQWTAPAGAESGRYHIVWSNKPIVEQNSLDTTRCNWWAAKVVGPDLTPAAGTRQALLVTVPDLYRGKRLYYALFTFDAQDNMSNMSNVASLVSTAVADGFAPGPLHATLLQNYPNPWNPYTMIRYSLSQSAQVRITIYNANGSLVRTLLDSNQNAGEHETSWNGKDDRDKAVAAGLYLYRMQTETFEKTGKMLLVR